MRDLDVQYRIPLEQGLAALEMGSGIAVYLQGRGLYPPPQPMIQTAAGPQAFQGQLPPDLTRLTDDQLGDLLTSIGRWCEFVQNELAFAHNAFNQADSQLDHIEAQLYLFYRNDENGKKRTDPEIKKLVLVDRRLVETKRNVLYYEGVHRIVSAMAKGADKNWDTVSRRITQRQQDLERGRRESTVGGIQAPNFHRR